MIVALRIFFAVVLCSMVVVTSWAGSQVALWSIPREIGGHPWFIATLFDAYWGFFTFYAWQWYKEPAWFARGLWFVALVLLGNMAMAAYGLIVTLRLPATAGAKAILLRSEPVSPFVPLGLIAALLAVAGVTAVL
jgi:hypothetical protein